MVVVVRGLYRRLSRRERKLHKPFTIVITEKYVYSDDNGNQLTVPENFMCDGASYAFDIGCSWIFHDYLYATHKWDNGTDCTFHQANRVMSNVLQDERNRLFRAIFLTGLRLDIIGKFRSSWANSYLRGPQFYNSNLL